jgi:two-component system, sensor histidine kinase PdtaS
LVKAPFSAAGSGRFRLPTIWPEQISLSSIRGRLALVLAVVFLPTGLLALQAGLTAFAAKREAFQQAAGVQELAAAAAFREETSKLREVARVLATQAPQLSANPGTCDITLRNMSKEFSEFAALTILNQDGSILCSNLENARGSATHAQSLINRAQFTTDAVTDFVQQPAVGGEPVVAAVQRALIGPNNRPLYSGVTRTVTPMLQRAINTTTNISGFAAITTTNGKIALNAGANLDPASQDALEAFLENNPEIIDRDAFPIGKYWVVASRISPEGLIVVRGWRPAPLNAGDVLAASWALAAPLALWALAVVLTWFAIEVFVTRPLSIIEKIARAYARGVDADAAEQLLQNAPIEIKSLRRTLAALTKTLRAREARIAEALDEERALLLEVNHRVKNNLQMIASILSIQARATSETAEARGLLRARERVQLLAIAYTKIYESGEVRDVSLDEIAANVARTLIAERATLSNKVNLRVSAQPIRGSVDRAVPFAFVVGECISILLDRIANDASSEVDLTIRVGLMGVVQLTASSPQVSTIEHSAGDLRLLNAFATQLRGELTFATEGSVQLEFPNASEEAQST